MHRGTLPPSVPRCKAPTLLRASRLDRASGDAPDRALRADVLRVRERVDHLEATGDTLRVHALEAATRHHPRRAVALLAGHPEVNRRFVRVPGRVQRSSEEGGARDVVGRVELEPTEEVAPVRRQRLEQRVPGGDEGRRLRGRGGCRSLVARGGLGLAKGERPPDALPVEVAEQIRQTLRSAASRRLDLEPELVADAARAERPEYRRGGRNRRRILDDELQPRLLPALGEVGLDEPPLVHGAHRRISIMAGR